jgi:hypothetical protein
MNDWFRSWHGAPTDNKWLVIGKRAGVAPGMVSAIVWALFDHASQRESDRGSVAGFDVETYSTFSGFDAAKIEAVLKALEDKGVTQGGRLAAWGKRQPKREDSSSSDRVRAHREKHETQRNAAERSETLEERRGDTEQNKTPPAGSNEPLGVSAPAKVSKKSQKTPFPEGWQPDERGLAFARAKGMDASRIEVSAARFRRHKTGTSSKDWNLEWEAWIVEDCARDGIKPPSVVPVASDAVFVAQDDPAFPALRRKFCEAKGKPPPIGSGGWYFDKSWLPAERTEALT